MNDIGHWEKLKVIGKGGSSTVYKGTLKSSGKLVAVKEIQTDGLSKEQILAIIGEVDTIKNLCHNNIVQYVGRIQSANHFFIFLEYADRGSLRQYYLKHGPLQESQVAYCMSQTLLGLEYLHGFGIAHRDIKGANILLTKESVMKLADFGASKRFDTESIVSGLKGTPHWMAPEVIKGTQLTDGWLRADVWSIGCTVVELVTGKVPYFMYENPMTAMYHIASGEAPPIRGFEVSENLVSFVRLCCNSNPDDRPAVSILLKHPFIVSAPKPRSRRRPSVSSTCVSDSTHRVQCTSSSAQNTEVDAPPPSSASSLMPGLRASSVSNSNSSCSMLHETDDLLPISPISSDDEGDRPSAVDIAAGALVEKQKQPSRRHTQYEDDGFEDDDETATYVAGVRMDDIQKALSHSDEHDQRMDLSQENTPNAKGMRSSFFPQQFDCSGPSRPEKGAWQVIGPTFSAAPTPVLTSGLPELMPRNLDAPMRIFPQSVPVVLSVVTSSSDSLKVTGSGVGAANHLSHSACDVSGSIIVSNSLESYDFIDESVYENEGYEEYSDDEANDRLKSVVDASNSIVDIASMVKAVGLESGESGNVKKGRKKSKATMLTPADHASAAHGTTSRGPSKKVSSNAPGQGRKPVDKSKALKTGDKEKDKGKEKDPHTMIRSSTTTELLNIKEKEKVSMSDSRSRSQASRVVKLKPDQTAGHSAAEGGDAASLWGRESHRAKKGARHSKSAGPAKGTTKGLILPPLEHTNGLPTVNGSVMTVPMLHLRHIKSAPTVTTRVAHSNLLPPIVSKTPDLKHPPNGLHKLSLQQGHEQTRSEGSSINRFSSLLKERIDEHTDEQEVLEDNGGLLAPRKTP